MSNSFAGRISHDIRDSVPDWKPFVEPKSRPGAPNVLYIVWDDMGFGAWDLYGGLIEMPNMKRIADRGVQFTQFHTTALCSPTRSSLLTGRSPGSNGMTTIGEFADGFPNISCVIPRENGFVSETLRARGYNTMAVGKWHLSPATEMSMGASKRTWPVQRGFDRFYGFLGGLTDQWYPDLWYDNHQVDPPAGPDDGYHLSKDLADRAIEFLSDSRATAPDKPWMMYFCPGACHAPHHVFREWSDRYRGTFDMGYEKYREIVLRRQKLRGLLPEHLELPDINPLAGETSVDGAPWLDSEVVRPWDDIDEDERLLLIRQAEVYAAFATYTDAQVGRVLDFLERTGQLENTVIVAMSDNGASAEGGPQGSVNENRWYNGVPENLADNIRRRDELGTEWTHPHFSNGWAMAFNTPFKMYKEHASWEGGTADPMILSWPQGLREEGTVCHAYMHAMDVVPTLYGLLGIEAPETIEGVAQSPIEGVDMGPVLLDPGSASPKQTQFYSMLGTRAIWRDGWQASTIHAPAPSGWGHFDQDKWVLHHLDHDRNQMHDLAAEKPELLAELIALWDEQAGIFNGYPLDDRTAADLNSIEQPSVADTSGRLVLLPGGAEIPERSFVIIGRSFSVSATLTVDDPQASGILFASGGRFGGHSLYLLDGVPHYVYNWLGELEQKLASTAPVATGRTVVVGAEFTKTGVAESSPTGTARLLVDGHVVAEHEIKVQPAFFSLSGEGSNVGRDRGQPVSSDYRSPFALTGATIDHVVVTTGDDISIDFERESEALFRRD
ncbi:arylsulfatase [Streptomyces sp. NBC_01358]|uniref:arylsulfatase n=1 Tax=Streptomyces sp. NBC_01358 TaxID=2903837 RepID=UPI002E33FD9E|nr:arylsulfatase [Streptomyces sp. NBC_01358]